MKKYSKIFKVVENTRLNPSFFLLGLELGESLPKIKPGQFVEILIENANEVFLRRPFSIHDVIEEENRLDILVQIIGKGTEALSNIKEDEELSLLFPLGNGFPIRNQKALLVGGGCGVAPLLHLSREIHALGQRPNLLIGARSKEQLFELDRFAEFSDLFISTEDGSEGIKGMVVDIPAIEEDYDIIYTCGPTPMMEAVAKIANQRNIPCYVSLENTMACGIGACLCCVVETKDGHKCTCTEGPVFLAEDLSSMS